MTAQEYADRLFAAVLEALPEARKESETSISYREARLDRVISKNNVNVLISENVPIAVLKREGAQAIETKMFDFNPNTVPLQQAIDDVTKWLNAFGGISYWVPLTFRTQALFLSANKVTDGPMFEYIVESLKALDGLLMHMENLYGDMLSKHSSSAVDSEHISGAQLARERIEQTLDQVKGGRQEVADLLRSLGVSGAGT